MKKIIVVEANGNFFVIIHVAPNMQGQFQWYWTDEPNNGQKFEIKGAIYESICIKSEDIKMKYKNKWLACHCEIESERYDEGCVYLTDDFIEFVKANKVDKISFCGEDGNIRTSYASEAS